MKTLNLNTVNSPLLITKSNFRLNFLSAKDNTYNQNIKYWIKNGRLLRLKNGVYIIREQLDREQNKTALYEYLATNLVNPVYLSMEYVLAKNEILTEAVYGITLVTTKSTRKFQLPWGLAQYHSIKSNLFTGWEDVPFRGMTIPTATRVKALFDYLYFRKRRWHTINRKSVEELRLKLSGLNSSDWQELAKYIEQARSRKLDLLFQLLQEIKDEN